MAEGEKVVLEGSELLEVVAEVKVRRMDVCVVLRVFALFVCLLRRSDVSLCETLLIRAVCAVRIELIVYP